MARVLRSGGSVDDTFDGADDNFDWDEEERDDEVAGGLIDLADVVGEGEECDIGCEFVAEDFGGADADVDLVSVVVGEEGRVDREFDVEGESAANDNVKGDGWH